MKPQIGLAALTLAAALVVGGFAENPGQSAGATLPAGATFGAIATENPADSGSGVGAAGELIGFSGSDGSGSQRITLVHTGKMHIAVYHIDRSGQIRLVNSRPIDADFSLTLNPTAPLPSQIRLMSGETK